MERSNLCERLGIQEDIIRKACSLAMAAHTSLSPTFNIDKPFNSPHAIFAFSGSWSTNDWFAGKSLGESKINKKLFPSLKSISNGHTAVVNESFLRQFETVLTTSNLQEEVKKAWAENRQMVFTGHSSGAPVAILATIWLQEEQKLNGYNHSFPYCITFGSPLIGDQVFGLALGREYGSDQFIHFVTRHDIVPRILFSPLLSIERELPGILHFLNPNSMHFRQDSIGKSQEASVFFSTVMRNASYVANQAACSFMGCTNPLLEAVTSFVELSPYRPFGTYVFCTENRKLVTLKNPEAVLQLLFYSLQLKPEEEVADAAYRSLQDHLIYEVQLEESLAMQDAVYLDDIQHLSLTEVEDKDDEIRLINAALKDLGLGARARICFNAARELERQKQRNQEMIDQNISKIEQGLKMLEEYQIACRERELGYYDAFKLQRENDDFNANLKRLELAGMWDVIKEMLKKFELPDDFEGRKVWINLGTNYRRLVEPLDIANYYRHSKNDDTGPYMIKGRPMRYRFTQRWLEHYRNVPEKSCSESCFWAEVEELCCCQTASEKAFEEVKDRILKLEKEVVRWLTSGEISKDIFLEDSTFIKWWKTLPRHHRERSCIAALMNGEGRNFPSLALGKLGTEQSNSYKAYYC